MGGETLTCHGIDQQSPNPWWAVGTGEYGKSQHLNTPTSRNTVE